VVVRRRRESKEKKTVDLIRAAGGDGLFLKADVSKAADVDALVLKTVESLALGCCVNNAGSKTLVTHH